MYHQLPEILDSFGIGRNQWWAELTQEKNICQQVDHFLRSAKKVIAVGGDGTIGLVLDRLRVAANQSGTEVGLIPLGTGNDLGRSLGVFKIYNQKGLLACLRRLIQAPAIALDLWDINGKKTLAAYLSMGIDASILRDFDTARKEGRISQGALYNKLYYIGSGLRHLGNRISKPATVTLTTKNGEVVQNLQGMVCFIAVNVNSYAAGSHPLAHVKPNDGWLDVIISPSTWRHAANLTLSRDFSWAARLVRRKMICYQVKEIHIKLSAGLEVQLDGEDITDFCSAERELHIQHFGQVQMLDLRHSDYALFN